MVKAKIGWFVSHRPAADKLPSNIMNTSAMTFGGRLITQYERNNNQVPKIVQQCVDAIEKRGLAVVGIYRLSGNSADIQKLKYLFNNGTQERKKCLFTSRALH